MAMTTISKPGTLKTIIEHLAARDDLAVVIMNPRREGFTHLVNSNWFELAEIRVAPVKPEYTVEGLQAILPTLVPQGVTVSPISTWEFGINPWLTYGGIKLAKLFFDEEVGKIRQARLIDAVDPALIDYVLSTSRESRVLSENMDASAKNPVSIVVDTESTLIRRIMLTLHPDVESTARAGDEFNMFDAPEEARRAFKDAMRAEREQRQAARSGATPA